MEGMAIEEQEQAKIRIARHDRKTRNRAAAKRDLKVKEATQEGK
jgi:hypothetical protein